MPNNFCKHSSRERHWYWKSAYSLDTAAFLLDEETLQYLRFRMADFLLMHRQN